jgi:hypothetical protein
MGSPKSVDVDWRIVLLTIAASNQTPHGWTL